MDDECGTSNVDCDSNASINSVSDLVTKDDSIRLLRCSPCEHNREETRFSSEAGHRPRSCKSMEETYKESFERLLVLLSSKVVIEISKNGPSMLGLLTPATRNVYVVKGRSPVA